MKDKRITNTAKLILNLWNISLFTIVWFDYYNQFVFSTFYSIGGFMTIVFYSIVYIALCNIYRGYRIASSEIGDTVFSQMLAIGIADLIAYIQCCLIYNHFVSLLHGFVIFVLQIIGTACIVTYTKQYMMKHIKPQKTMIIYGKDISIHEVERFKLHILKKYEHLFEIDSIINENEEFDLIEERVNQSEVVTLYEVSKEQRAKLLCLLMEKKKIFYLTPSIDDILLQGCSIKHLLDTPLVKYDYRNENKSLNFNKRLFDILFSAIILLLVSPILILVSLAIKIEDHGPVFFKQKRCTKDGRVFEILKFRSMIVDAEKNGVTPCVDHDPRITKVGNFIRKTRIDELPQFINILKGDMSVVGPRPERVEHVEQYMKEVPEFRYRMEVLGGLTGYAQIYGKYNTSPYDKLRLDLLYIENQSFLLDMKLILLTIKIMFIPESTEGFDNNKSTEILLKSKAELMGVNNR